MVRVNIPLIGPSYTNRSLPLSAQVTKGLIPEINPEARNIVSLHTFPGLLRFAFAQSGKGRGTHVMAGVLYAVFGDALFSTTSAGVTTNRGEIVGTGICDFADNGVQMFIATGSTPYLYTVATTTLEEVTDPDVNEPTTVDYLNAQFIFDDNAVGAARGTFRTSQVLTTLSATDFAAPLDVAVANAHPDAISRIKAYNGTVIFFGPDGFEPWWNSGVGSPPFDKIQSAFRPYGLIGKDAIDISDEFIYFIDDQRIPRRLFGLQVTNIGNPALAAEWSKYATVDDAIVYTFILDHRNYSQYTFPTANRTWLYHEQSNSWYKLSFGTDDQRHKGQSQEFVYGKNIIQDSFNGRLYELDFDTFTDNTRVIQRRRTTAVIHGGLYGFPGKEIFFDKVQFVIQTGVGVVSGQGVDPRVMIRSTDNGGRTWTAEQWHSLGVAGAYETMVELDEQGSAFARVYELVYTEPTPFSLIDANAEVSFGI